MQFLFNSQIIILPAELALISRTCNISQYLNSLYPEFRFYSEGNGVKVLIINDTSCSPNWGARATSYALKKMISQTGNHRITCISQDELLGNKRPQNTVNRSKDLLKLITPPIFVKLKQEFSSNRSVMGKIQNIPVKWEDFESVSYNIINKKTLLSNEIRLIKRADLVVIQGEGCIYGNTFHSRLLLFLGYLSKWYFNKPAIIVNHTADFSHPELLKIAQNVYPLFDDVVFREPVSGDRNRGFCEGRVGADAAFVFKPKKLSQLLTVANRDSYFDFWPDTAHFDPAKPYICIGGGSALPSRNSSRYDPVEKLSGLISHLLENFNHQIVLTASGSTDLNIFRALQKKFNLPLLGLTIPFLQAVDILGNADAYIGGRWHPSIFALRGGTPVILFTANSFKMEALLKMFSLSGTTFDPGNLDNDNKAIANLLFDYLNEGEGLRQKLRHRAKEEAQKVRENIAYLKKAKVKA